MKPLILLPLILASCTSFKDCPREYTICDPKTGRCTCEAPTGALPDVVREKGDRMPDAHRPSPQPPTNPEPPKPEPPKEPPKEPPHEGPKHPGKEPDRRTDPEGHHAWQERRDAYKAAGGVWP